MRRKRILSIAAVVCAFACICMGCKKDVGTPEDNAAAVEKEEKREPYKFGFSGITMENSYYITLEQSIREDVEKAGDTLITMNPGMDADKQAEQIQEMVDQGVNAVFLSPVNWKSIRPSLELLKESGVKIINVDTQVRDFELVDAYIGSDNEMAGYLCGEDLVERFPEGGKVVILECPTMNSINNRITGFEKAIADHGFEVVSREDTMGDLETSLEVASGIVEKHQDIVAIMCGNDPTAQGALVALNTAGLKNILVYGIDGSPELKKELLKKDTPVAGTSGQSPINMGKSAARTAFAMLNGEDYEEEIIEEVFFINKENVEMYGVDGWQ